MTPEEQAALCKALRDALKIMEPHTMSAAHWAEHWGGRSSWTVFAKQSSDGVIATNFCHPDPMPEEHWVEFKHNRNDR